MTSSPTARYREYPKWVGGQIVRNAAEEAEALGPRAAPAAPVVFTVEGDNLATEGAVLDAPAADPLDHDSDGRKGGSKRGRKPHRKG